MATITAEAKLYNGIRLLCVDANAQGSWTSTVTSEIIGDKIRFGEAKISTPIFSLSLTDERYLTYGGAADIEAIGSTLRCKFPTYVRFDLEALGVPEGVDIILQLEEGFVLEGEEPSITPGLPLPKVDNLFAFRTPKKFASYPTATFTLTYDEIELTTPFEANIAMVASPFVITANLSPASAFAFPTTVAIVEAVANADFILQPTSIIAFSAINIPIDLTRSHGRLRFGASDMVEDASAMTIGDFRLRRFEIAMSAEFTLDAPYTEATAPLVGVNTQPVETFMITTAVKTTDTQSNISSNAVLSSQPVKTVSAISTTPAMNALVEAITDLTFIMQTNLNSEDYTGGSISNTTEIEIPVGFVGHVDTINVTVDWGDGNTDNYTTQQWASHTYSQHGEYKVRIIADKDLNGLGSLYNSLRPLYYNKVKELRCWGFNTFILDPGGETFSLQHTFARVPYTGLQVPDWLPQWPDADLRFDGMFVDSKANPSNVVYWDLSNNYRSVFPGNGDIRTINAGMFAYAENFNQDINVWNITKIKDGEFNVFGSNTSFNQDLGDLYNINESRMIAGVVYTFIMNLHETAINEENLNRSIIGWANRRSSSGAYSGFKGYIKIPNDLSITTTSYGSGTYTTGASAKQYLENQGWQFISSTRYFS